MPACTCRWLTLTLCTGVWCPHRKQELAWPPTVHCAWALSAAASWPSVFCTTWPPGVHTASFNFHRRHSQSLPLCAQLLSIDEVLLGVWSESRRVLVVHHAPRAMPGGFRAHQIKIWRPPRGRRGCVEAGYAQGLQLLDALACNLHGAPLPAIACTSLFSRAGLAHPRLPCKQLAGLASVSHIIEADFRWWQASTARL